VKKGLRFKVGMAAMPHPFKRHDGVGANRRYTHIDTQTHRQGEAGLMRGCEGKDSGSRNVEIGELMSCVTPNVLKCGPFSFVSCRCLGWNDH
jgi:hypothetical protein